MAEGDHDGDLLSGADGGQYLGEGWRVRGPRVPGRPGQVTGTRPGPVGVPGQLRRAPPGGRDHFQLLRRVSDQPGHLQAHGQKQQMRWTPRGVHLLLQVRTRVLNGDLADDFRRWHPGFTYAEPDREELIQAA
jgi:hypothetical protein